MSGRATVISDASWCPFTRAGGWAVWIALDNTKNRIKLSGTFKERPENSYLAERMALINGIWVAQKSGASIILAQSDCNVVVDKLNDGKYKTIFSEIGITAKVSARHVKGHTKVKDNRSYVNRWCDKHAKKHMKKQRKETV